MLEHTPESSRASSVTKHSLASLQISFLVLGGGIVPGANPDEEVTEIGVKFQPMRRALVCGVGAPAGGAMPTPQARRGR